MRTIAARVRAYYRLAKPGIVYGNLFTTLAAFLFASEWHVSLVLLCATLVGLGLVIAGACVFNNYLDRDIDRLMARTKDRALVSGAISTRAALVYATLLTLVGLALLYGQVNILTSAIAFVGLFLYVVVYGIGKRRSSWGTVIGSISGAVPIVVGYTAVADRLDGTALILFLILALWQMPHFYAIAIYRLDDYKAAGIPVLPAVSGIAATKRSIIGYVIAFIIATASLTIFGHARSIYLAIVLIIGAVWLYQAIGGLRASDDVKWARKLFFFSLIVLVVFSLALSVASLLPL